MVRDCTYIATFVGGDVLPYIIVVLDILLAVYVCIIDVNLMMLVAPGSVVLHPVGTTLIL